MASAFIKSLPESAKVWFSRAVAGVILADGKVNEDELFYLKGTIMFLGDDLEVKNIIDSVKAKQTPQLDRLTVDRKTAARMFIELVKLTVTDDKLTREEAQYFVSIGTHLGFDSIFSKKVLEWGKKFCEVNREMKILMKEGENSDPIIIEKRDS
ncbi:MAG: hypothetical protein HQM13_21235 [SAR324 cluster bacterium]|nr:hypothetical protein [SAR324 cluster bacterium]